MVLLIILLLVGGFIWLLRLVDKIQMNKELILSYDSIEELIREYSPYEFEEYIAKLYRKMGYEASTTSRTNDGGFDVV